MQIARPLFAILVLLFAPLAASADEPRGPPFGANRCTAAIVAVGGEPDVDNYVADLIAGERISVEVASARDSSLRPTLRFVAPGGIEVDPEPTVRRDGEVVRVRSFVVPTSGKWTVRVGAAGKTEGEYVARFDVAPPAPVRLRGERFGGAAPEERNYEFQAVDGAALTASVRSAGGAATIQSIVEPSGKEIALDVGATEFQSVALAGGAGAYRLVVGVDDGREAVASLRLRVTPPARPKGRTNLAPEEPFLHWRSGPLDAVAGSVVRLGGAHFSTIPPYPSVWFDETKATVAAVGPYGAYLDVVAPARPDGEVVDVAVQNLDGQAVARPAYVRYVSARALDVLAVEPAKIVLQQGARRTFVVTLTRPAPPLGLELQLATTGGVGAAPSILQVDGGSAEASFELLAADAPTSGTVSATLVSTVTADVVVAPPAGLASITPPTVQLLEGAAQTFAVALESPAPPAGIDAAITVSGGIGTAPAWLHVNGGETGAEFTFTAGAVRSTGRINVSSANFVEAAVGVVPPTTIDVSGWTIVQQNSARTFTIPSGTVLSEGGYVVVGRNASRSLFESFWGRTLGAGVVYFDGGDQFPQINGSETYELRDAAGASVDGPSVAMTSAGGLALRRVPGTPAGTASSWTSASASPVADATPGTGQSAAAAPAGVYVSEFSDANGTGNFVYEFVELFFDRRP